MVTSDSGYALLDTVSNSLRSQAQGGRVCLKARALENVQTVIRHIPASIARSHDSLVRVRGRSTSLPTCDVPALTMEPPSEFATCLSQLQCLIDHLPGSLPHREVEDSCYSSFKTHAVSTELIERTGDEASALNEHMKGVFGWKTRTSGDGVLTITERGPGLRNVVGFLEHFYKKYPDDAVLQKWGRDIWTGAVKVYTANEIPVRAPKYCFVDADLFSMMLL